MTKLHVIVLAFNETSSLVSTIDELVSITPIDQVRITISTSHKATELCQMTAENLASKNSNVAVYYQQQPYVAAAVMEAVAKVESDFTIYMSADNETPANLVPLLLQEIETSRADIVSTSRWIAGGSFTEYGRIKYLLSLSAQVLCKIIYISKLTEFTYGFRIYRTQVFNAMVFKEKKHPFFLESLLVPLKLGYRIIEIPVRWVPRSEGESVVTISTLISYLRPIFRIRFTPRASLTALHTEES